MAYKDLLARTQFLEPHTVSSLAVHTESGKHKDFRHPAQEELAQEKKKKSVYPVAKSPSFFVFFSGIHKVLYNMKSDIEYYLTVYYTSSTKIRKLQ